MGGGPQSFLRLQRNRGRNRKEKLRWESLQLLRGAAPRGRVETVPLRTHSWVWAESPSSNEEKPTAASLEASVTGLQGCWDFPAGMGGPLAETLRSHCRGHGFYPRSGN